MFSIEEKKFIVRAFSKNPSPTKVRREFLRHYNVQKGRKQANYQLLQFIRVNEEFEKSGSVVKKPKNRPCTKRTAENLNKLSNMMEEGSLVSLRQAAPNVSVSAATAWRMLRYDAKAKFYRVTAVQPLTEAHKEQRRQFCEWILEQEEDFVHRVIWTDEKFFVLRQKPHRRNDGKWSTSNCREMIETNDRNGAKVMIFVSIVDGKVPIVHAFITEDGRSVSVTGASYLELLKDTVWPTFRSTATRKQLWWMQDGAPPHCTNDAKAFLLEKFNGRVISRGTDRIWPAHSPDINPLDFHFWSAAQREVYRQKPQNIEELVQCVQDFATACDQRTIKKVAANVLKRARLCLQAGGGHFQHLL